MKLFSSYLLLFVLVTTFQISNDAQANTQTVNVISDGPYIFLNDKHKIDKIINVCHNSKVIQNVSDKDNIVITEDCSGNKALSFSRFYHSAKTAVEYKTAHSIAAISDFHGQYELMATILTNNGVIDENGNWDFDKGHLVITGDVFDRGDKVTEILWFLFNLEKQAIKQGGRVHLLLGNHETMVLNDDLRYLHPKYFKVEKILKQSYSSLYGDNTILGQWLRSKNVLVKINNILFAHGGFHPNLVKKELPLKKLNQVFSNNITKPLLPIRRSELGDYLHKTNGPIWYRGYFREPLATSDEIDNLLRFYKINHIVVGHTSQTNIKSRYDGRVIAIDSSIKNGKYGEILLIEKSKLVRGTMEGNKLPIEELSMKE
ncbi:metallophosphoesterase [Thalassotalea nanhaiensis]|uniref:Metallophosphoesterase n=1 Tax=Thalassotalea nanhaiensis TaxID=3065648 RepID=A0ABY9TNI3_9GAMM|nr:metallophosphoesterase [Colwelliaceae bacterium SQ345]